MRAMILAAGFGTRLLPLTRHRPKCLMPVMNRPLLGLWLERLTPLAELVVVNTHYLAPMVREFIDGWPAGPARVVESHEPEILGTGGGLVAARDYWAHEPFLLANADVVCGADPMGLMEGLEAGGAVAVLGLVDQPRFNTVALGADGRVAGFKGDAGLGRKVEYLTYTGLAALSPRLLDYLPPGGYSSLVDGLRAAMAAGQTVLGQRLPAYWDDLGSVARLWGLHHDLAHSPPPGLERLAPAGPILAAPGATIEDSAELRGFCVLAQDARIECGARVQDSVLLPGATVAAGAKVTGAILADGFIATKEINGGGHG